MGFDVAGHCDGFVEGEEPVPDPTEKWLRACSSEPDKWDKHAQAATNLVFQLGSEDRGQLSGARSSKSDAVEMYDHLTTVEKRNIAEIRSIQVDRLTQKSLHLHDDSALLPPPPASPKGHTYLDLRHLPTGKRKPDKLARERIRAYLLDASVPEFSPDIAPDLTDQDEPASA